METNDVQLHWFRPLSRLKLSSRTTASQSDHRRRGGRLHRRRRHRRRVAAQRRRRDCNAQRDTHFRIVGPAVDGLRAAFLDNCVETDHELFGESVDRFPISPSRARRSRNVCCGARKRVGATSPPLCVRSSSSRTNASASPPPTSCPIRRSPDACATPPPAKRERRSAHPPAPTPTNVSCKSVREGVVRRAARPRREPLELPAVDAARQGDDGRRRRGQRWIRQPQQPIDGARRRDQRRRARHRRGPNPRRALRRGPRSQHQDRTRTLGRTLTSAESVRSSVGAPLRRFF